MRLPLVRFARPLGVLSGRGSAVFRLPLRFALGLAVLAPAVHAQTLPFVHFRDFTDSLQAVAAIPDATMRSQRVSALWDALRAEGRVPFTEGDSAAFLWRGSASAVAAAGDHTGWDPAGHGLTRVGLSDVWMRVYRFPQSARIDYKLVVNRSNWVLDPSNPHQQWSGFGPNSELRMPAWVFPQETVRQAGTPQGAFTGDLLFQSDTLNAPVRYRVYTPPGYAGLSGLPVVYVTDGHEYADDRLGAMRIVLDNEVAAGRAAPAVVVFIDPRSPTNGQNLRQAQYVQNPAFAYFVARELVPAVDAAYRTRTDREGRVILGTSLGGVFATYLGLLHSDVFGRLAIQSPAYWVSESAGWWTGPSLFEMMSAAPAGLFAIYLSTGTINDGETNARRMRAIMETHGHEVMYREVAEGHSWGQWRALLDEVLAGLLPPAPLPTEPRPRVVGDLRLDAYPNPARGRITLRFDLDAAGPATLACFDVQGRHVVEVLADTLSAGEHARSVGFAEDGTYVCRLQAGGRSATRNVAFAR